MGRAPEMKTLGGKFSSREKKPETREADRESVYSSKACDPMHSPISRFGSL